MSSLAADAFYLAGGYKYAMAGEGAALLHAPPGFGPRPVQTGWYAEFGDLEGPPGGVGYVRDAGRFMGATFDPSGIYRFVAAGRMLEAQGLSTAVGGFTLKRMDFKVGEGDWANTSIVADEVQVAFKLVLKGMPSP